MLFNIFAICMTGPSIHKVKDNKPLKSAAVQQGNAIRNFNKMLGCHRPDAAKVKYDAEQAAKAAKGEE